ATPVVITGLSDVPPAGAPFEEVESEQEARARAYERIQARRAKETKSAAISLNDLYAKFKEGSVKELNLLVKADVAGSLEPIVSSLEKLGDGNLHAKILRQGIGAVTQADVMLAAASQGIIIAFNVNVENAAEALAEQEQVDIRKYNIIYKLIEDIRASVKNLSRQKECHCRQPRHQRHDSTRRHRQSHARRQRNFYRTALVAQTLYG
ncbi:MAG: hypothetical protein DCC52_19395, partial [Chloroflexi bacterium]